MYTVDSVGGLGLGMYGSRMEQVGGMEGKSAGGDSWDGGLHFVDRMEI